MGNAGCLCVFLFLFFPGRKTQYSSDSGTVALELDAGELSPSSSVYCWMTLSKLCNLLQKPHLKYDERDDIYLVKLLKAMPALKPGQQGPQPWAAEFGGSHSGPPLITPLLLTGKVVPGTAGKGNPYTSPSRPCSRHLGPCKILCSNDPILSKPLP